MAETEQSRALSDDRLRADWEQNLIRVDLVRFLPPICWHSLSADFVDKSTAKCGHR